MDASTALAQLVGVSTQVVEAVVSAASGSVEAARTSSDTRARELAKAGAELLARARRIRTGAPVERVQVDLEHGSLVAVTDGRRTIVARTVARPTTALVALDLRTALRGVGEDAT